MAVEIDRPVPPFQAQATSGQLIELESLAGKQVTLTYAEPGTWFGDIALFDGLPRTHDAHAQGAAVTLHVPQAEIHVFLGGELLVKGLAFPEGPKKGRVAVVHQWQGDRATDLPVL